MYMPCDNYAANSQVEVSKKTINYYSTHNFATRVSSNTLASVHNSNHDGAVRNFMDFSWELYCQQQSKQAVEQWWSKGRQNPTTKVKFTTVWVSGRQWSWIRRYSQDYYRPFLSSQTLIKSFYIIYLAQFSPTRTSCLLFTLCTRIARYTYMLC